MEANTTYLVQGATRVWFYDKDNNPTTTINAYKDTNPQYQFTTPDGTAYMGVSYTTNSDLMQRGAETVVKIGAVNAVTDVLLSSTGLVPVRKGLNSGSYKEIEKDATFTYKEIPVEAGATYYTRGGTRVWFLDSNKVALTTSGKTANIYSEANPPYTVTAPAGAAFVSIAYAETVGAKADMVYIRKLT